jgi:cellulose synthase/poly-beta-1,6-N-acetylglucosamine synthase-like glycosyltransferase
MQLLGRQQTPDVEILIETDNRKITTGAKRNLLLHEAHGDYIAFVDDDDEVASDYVQKILAATATYPDCCGMEGQVTFQRTGVSRRFIHSLKYKSWFEKDGVYYRCPNHISPVRRGLALSVGFPDLTIGEDRDYSMRLLPLLRTESCISGILYYYKAR